jgi:hypothetical protein
MDQRTDINIAYPATADLHLRIGVGACRFRIVPGAYDAWVRGTYHDPTGALPLKITQDGGTAQITQEPASGVVGGLLHGGTPTLELGLGTNRPYTLTIEGGASENSYDLGGLPLTRLTLKQGGGKFTVDFSTPNPVAMGMLDLDGGAGAFEMRNLANANAAEMTVDGGASSQARGSLLDTGSAGGRHTAVDHRGQRRHGHATAAHGIA